LVELLIRKVIPAAQVAVKEIVGYGQRKMIPFTAKAGGTEKAEF